jgi:hypothetical protein
MAKIFVSHSWDDKPLVRDLESRLREAGAEVWVDHAKVRGGDNLPKRISDALDWCDTLLLLWSKAAAESKWVEKEWTCAISLERTVIPCQLDATRLPPLLANLLYVDLRDREPGVERLMTALKLSLPTNKAAAAAAPGAQPPAVSAEAGSVPEKHLRALLPKEGDDTNCLVFCLGAMIDIDEKDDLYALLADISNRRSRRSDLDTIFAVSSADSSLELAHLAHGQRLTTYSSRDEFSFFQDPFVIDFSKGPPGLLHTSSPRPNPRNRFLFPSEAIVFLGGHSLNDAILDYFAPVKSSSPRLPRGSFVPFRYRWSVDPSGDLLLRFDPSRWSQVGQKRQMKEADWASRGVTVISTTLRDYIGEVRAYLDTCNGSQFFPA